MPLSIKSVIGLSTKNPRLFTTTFDHESILFASGSRVVLSNLKDITRQKLYQSDDGDVHALTPSKDSELLASAHGDGRLGLYIYVWRVSDGECILRFDAPRDIVTTLSFSSDNRLLAAGTKGGRTIILDISSSQSIIATKPGTVPHYVEWDLQAEAPNGVDVSGPVYKLYSASEKYLHEYVLCAETPEITSNIRVFTMSKDFPVPGMLKDLNAVSLIGPHLIFGCQLGDLSFYDTRKSAFVYKIRPCLRGCTALAGANDTLYSSHNNGHIYQIKISEQSAQTTGEANVDTSISSLSLSNKGEVLFTTIDGRLFSLNPRMMNTSVLLHSPSSNLLGLTIDASGKFVGVAGHDGVSIWNTANLKMVSKKTLPSPSLSCKFDVSGWDNGSVCLTSFEGGMLWERKLAHQFPVTSVACTQVSYISGDSTGAIHVWTRKTHELVMKYHIQRKRIREILPDSVYPTLIHSCGEDGSVSTFDMREERIVSNHINKEEGPFTSIVQSKSGTVYTTGKPPIIQTWERGRLAPVGTIALNEEEPVIMLHSAAISPCGRYIVCFSQDDYAYIWDMKSNQMLSSQSSGAKGVQKTLFSPDGSTLYGIEASGSIVAWSFNPNDGF